MAVDNPDGQLVLGGEQPWISAPPPNPEQAEKLEKKREEREAVLRALANSRFATVYERVAVVLRDFPDARESDTALLIRYWKRFQAEELAEANPFQLEVLFELENVETIIRARRHIQNALELFQPSPYTQQRRGELQIEFSQYLASQREGDAEIHFYLDETGSAPNERYTGIGGICILDPRLFALQHAALRQWRDERPWPETLHFADLKESKEEERRFLDLLAELKRRRSGLLFVGYAIAARQSKEDVFVGVIGQLVVDALRRLADLGCLNTMRAVTVIKESQDGFDKIYLPRLENSLFTQLGREFPGRAYLKKIVPIPKGREVLLECADVIASGMRRRALMGGRNPKDRVAEAVANVTGFEDPKDQGAVFRYFE